MLEKNSCNPYTLALVPFNKLLRKEFLLINIEIVLKGRGKCIYNLVCSTEVVHLVLFSFAIPACRKGGITEAVEMFAFADTGNKYNS